MPLETGTYIIRNQGALIGRDPNEDCSLNPKAIVRLPEETDKDFATWKIEKIGNRYIMSCKGAPTAPDGGKVYADLSDDPKKEKWILESIFHHGKNNYVIQAEDRYQGWVGPYEESEDKQLMSRPLIVGPSYPPFYPPFERFEIVAKHD